MSDEEEVSEQEVEFVKGVAEQSLERRKEKVTDEEAVQNELAENMARMKEVEFAKMEREMAEKILPYAASKSELKEMETRIDAKIEALKELLLRARAQGKAHIREKEKDDLERLKEIYAGMGVFD